MSNPTFSELTSDELTHISGGAGNGADWTSIKQQAAQYCPTTAARYANINPSSITRAKAQQMGNACVAEISPFFQGMARGRIDHAINEAFPAKK